MDLINYTSAGVSIRAEQFGPQRGRPVIIAHGSDGITDNLSGPWATTMREFADTFALAGYRVLLPYYFDKTGTQPGLPAMESILVNLPAWQQALADAITFAGGRPALVGFSLGGHLSLRLRGSASTVVEFFAPFLNGLSPAPATPARVQIHHGESDRLVSITNAAQIASQLTAEHSTVEVHRYPNAGHGFGGTNPGDAAALKQSKTLTVAFVSETK